MKKLLVFLMAFISFLDFAWSAEVMKIKLTLDSGKEVVVQMSDNSAARQFVQMLPAEFEFIDFAGEEKISEFPKPISLKDAPRGMIATAGKMFIYAPWGNFGFFYKNRRKCREGSPLPLSDRLLSAKYMPRFFCGRAQAPRTSRSSHTPSAVQMYNSFLRLAPSMNNRPARFPFARGAAPAPL